MTHTIFFDVGGTIVTTKSTLTFFAEILDPDRKDEIFEYLVESFMLYYENENIDRFYTIREIIAISVRMAAEKFNLPDLSAESEKYYRLNHLRDAALFDDTIPILENLKKKNIRMIICSDADADVLVEQLKMLGICYYFDDLIISSDVGAYKPHDKMVKAVLKRCREPYSEIFFVGDNRVDMETARKTKIKSVLINRKGRFKCDADYKITTLSELFDIIHA